MRLLASVLELLARTCPCGCPRAFVHTESEAVTMLPPPGWLSSRTLRPQSPSCHTARVTSLSSEPSGHLTACRPARPVFRVLLFRALRDLVTLCPGGNADPGARHAPRSAQREKRACPSKDTVFHSVSGPGVWAPGGQHPGAGPASWGLGLAGSGRLNKAIKLRREGQCVLRRS